MSKSLNNAIFLSDEADVVQKKVMSMYTDPKRIRATDPGETDPEKNPLWAFHETFNPDSAWVREQQEAYRLGKVGDVAIKRKLVEVLNTIIDPIRTRRKQFDSAPTRSSTCFAQAPAEPMSSPKKRWPWPKRR